MVMLRQVTLCLLIASLASCIVETGLDDAGPTPPCQPGAVLPCAYTGPDGTEGIGICQAPTRVCQPDGTWNNCTGQVEPKTEDCATPQDDDCDGQSLDDECACVPGTAKVCYSGPGGTEGVGACHAGVQMCDVDGLSFGPCVGAEIPRAERCYSPEDESCDGAGDCTGTLALGKSFGDASSQNGVDSIAVTPAGDVILAGTFEGTVNWGDADADLLTSAGGMDVYVAKLDSNLNHLWSKRFGDSDQQDFVIASADASGTVVLAGQFHGSIGFEGCSPLSSTGTADTFVAELDGSGKCIWSRSFGGDQDVRAWGMTIDASGHVLLTGGFTGAVDFGGGALVSAGQTDAFVLKLDADGMHSWSKRYGGPQDDTSFRIAVDGAQNVVIAGMTTSAIDFGGGSLAGAGGQDAFVAKLDPNASHVWSKRFGDAEHQIAAGVTVDGEGNAFVAGKFLGSIDLGGGPLVSQGGFDGYLVKFDSAGKHAWSKRFGGAGDQGARELIIDGAGNVILSGEFVGSINFGGAAMTSAGGPDAFVAKFDTNGSHLWSKQIGGADEQYATGIAAGIGGDVFATGVFTGSLELADGQPMASKGSWDIFVSRFNP